MELIDKIKAIAPEAVCSETGEPVITLKVDDFRRVAEMLRADKEAPMDYLRDIVGMDWGEKGLGALYYLESSQTYERVALKISTLDRENAFLPSVCDLWKTAEIKEREVFDFLVSVF